MRLDVCVALSLLAVAVTGARTASAQISDDVVRIGVLNDQSNVYADLGGQGSVIAARMRSMMSVARYSASRSTYWWRTTRAKRM
jgi:hypothetical protein